MIILSFSTHKGRAVVQKPKIFLCVLLCVGSVGLIGIISVLLAQRSDEGVTRMAIPDSVDHRFVRSPSPETFSQPEALFIPQQRSVMKKQDGITATIQPEIGISKEDLSASVDILNKILATEFTLTLQEWGYHWNLVGPEFHDYHILFQDLYEKGLKFVDAIAERVRAVGGVALGTMTEFLQHSYIKEDMGPIPAPKDMVYNLLVNQEVLIRHIRQGINTTEEKRRDMGTSNFLQEILVDHEKMAWMLRSLLERRK